MVFSVSVLTILVSRTYGAGTLGHKPSFMEKNGGEKVAKTIGIFLVDYKASIRPQ